jgi:hypothetical protein
MATEHEAEAYVTSLIRELGEASQFTFLVPGWDAVNSIAGLHWVRSSLWEGFYVAHKIDHHRRLVYLKSWEFGQAEPPWDSLGFKA